MNLGLDLKGGMNVILEVSVKDVLKGVVANAKDPMFVQAISSRTMLRAKVKIII